MHVERGEITFTTDTNSAATEYTDKVLNGRVLQVQYVKTDLADASTITLTGETTGVPIMAITGMNASATHLPRKAITSGAGTAVTYDATQTVHECIVIDNERVKMVIASGGSEKTGIIYVTVG